MRVTVIQMSPGHALRENLAAMTGLVRAACQADRPDLVVLPEMWSCLGGDLDAKWAAAENLPDPGEPNPAMGPIYDALRTLARSERVTLHGGSVGERAGGARLFNTTLVFGPDGQERARYRKIHLFDVVTPDGSAYRESDRFEGGQRLATFETGGMIGGCAICYDLRFPTMFAALRDVGCVFVTLPAAFTVPTGEAHWSTLLRARAIDNQIWMCAAATTGPHADGSGGTRGTFGHSMICDPWGTVVAQASSGVGWASASVDHALGERIRRDMPVWSHRRPFA